MVHTHTHTHKPNPYEIYISLQPLTQLWHSESRWPLQTTVMCAFQSIELMLRLIDEVATTHETWLFPERRLERFVEVLLHEYRLTARLLRDLATSDDLIFASGYTDVSPGLETLAFLHRNRVQAISDQFFLLFKELPFAIGVEEQLNILRQQKGLGRYPLSDKPVLDYVRIVSPTQVMANRPAEVCGPEEHLFITIHQSIECWMHLVHRLMGVATTEARSGHWLAAAQHIEHASQCVYLTAELGELLNLMTLADFQPLRVQLREASGAQSKAVQQLPRLADTAYQPLQDALADEAIPMLHVLESPAQYQGYYAYIDALKNFSKQCQDFLFRHYTLTLSVMGTNTLGSLGYRINTMVERAATPLLKEINQAQHDYVIITNFRYGKNSGKIILQRELAAGYNPRPGCVDGIQDATIMHQRVKDYFHYIETRDGNAWVALFDQEQGQFCDAPGSKPYVGAKKLQVFIDSVFDTFATIKASLNDITIEGNQVSVAWQFDNTTYTGQRVSYGGVERFTFDAKGAILTATAIWNPADIAYQLWPAA
ncbi:MAG: nuclear transport factor 2 family protein [Chloroflexota bacterium]